MLSCSAALVPGGEGKGCGLLEVRFAAVPDCGVAEVTGSINIGCASLLVSHPEVIELCCEHHEESPEDDQPWLCQSDLDGDGFVAGSDLGLLLLAWGTADRAADLNHDRTVDGADLGALLTDFGPCELAVCAFANDAMLHITSFQALLEVDAYDDAGNLIDSCVVDLCELVHP